MYSVHCNLESPGTQSSAIQSHRCPHKGLKGTIVNQTFIKIIGRSLDVTLPNPVPSKKKMKGGIG